MSFLESIPALRTLGPSALESLAGRTRPARFASGTMLRPSGGVARDVVFLLAGTLVATHGTSAGVRVWPEWWVGPAIADKPAVISGTPSPSGLMAITSVSTRLLPRADFLHLLDGERALRAHVLAKLARDAMSARLKLARASTLPAAAQVALWLAEQHHDQRVAWHGSQEQLALMLGLSRVTVNRTLARFTRAGAVLLTPHGIVVADRSRLQAFVED